ncbi:hypothetical protein BC834DRAFT_967205 [Gloeopeniophorella convolvens]|nr:hypothetical protein BC834DRAFT_967205 [Gloeopeniophorella convolvens]
MATDKSQRKTQERKADAATSEAAHPEATPRDLPDRVETVEWKEGPDRIIERCPGPGEDVEVEVQRNVYGSDEGEGISRTLRDGRAAAHHAAEAVVDGLRHSPREMKDGLKGTFGRGGNDSSNKG